MCVCVCVGGEYRKCNKSISSLYLFLFFSFNTNSALHLSVWLLSVWLETQSSCMVGKKKMKRKDKRPQMQREILFKWIAPLIVTQMKMLITIQSHISLIIRVMMWINYQLNSWSHKSVVDLLCIMGCYSRDGEVNTHLTVQRHGCLVWYSVMFFNRWSKYKSKCRLSHMQICKERP